MADKQQPTPGEIVIMAAGAVMLIGSFLPFYELSVLGFSRTWNAWSNGWSLFPLTTLMVLIGTAIAVQVVLARFASVSFRNPVGRFTWGQLHVALSVLVALTAIAYVIRDTHPVDKGAGAWLIVIGAIGLAVGAVMTDQQRATSAS